MKRICLLILGLLIVLTGCSKKDSSPQLSAKDLTNYIGLYEDANKDSYFEIIDVTDDGEVFFQTGWWIDEQGGMEELGGTGQLNQNAVEFSISASDSQMLGSFSFEDRSVTLSITQSTLPYLEPAEYIFFFADQIPDNRSNHDAFESFLENYPLPAYDSWQYCGETHLVFTKPGLTFPSWFTLYKIEASDSVTFYAVEESYINNRISYEIFRIGKNASLELLFSSENLLTSEIPKLSSFSSFLSADFEALKIRMGYELNGPSDSWRNSAQSSLFLQNIDDLDCYLNVYANPRKLIGVRNGEIQFYGYDSGSADFRVKDFLSNESLLIDPAEYSVRNGMFTAYVWELQDGYLSITALSVPAPWYERPVHTVVEVKSVEYLSFIQP